MAKLFAGSPVEAHVRAQVGGVFGHVRTYVAGVGVLLVILMLSGADVAWPLG